MEEIVKNPPLVTKAEKRASPFLKLFGPNPVINGTEVDLRKIRDRIYSHAWSRERRDEQKSDFVISQWGVNRNVPERFISDTHYGTSAFQHPEKLRCNLHLVNKKVSADFCRYIYSVNDVEIDIDLKPDFTEQTEVQLQKIVDFLQNQNLQTYTQTVKVRIHFPSKYPINDLPSFNQRTLKNIAGILDNFRELQYLTIRMVPSQNKALDYELRYAVFPFYVMRMTRWSVRTLNLDTLKWDLVDGQQVNALDEAWETYKNTGIIPAAKLDSASVKTASSKGRVPSVPNTTVLSNMNGSQKRKHRKRRTTPAAFAKTLDEGNKVCSEPVSTPAPSASPGAALSSGTAEVTATAENLDHNSTTMPTSSRGPPSPPKSPSNPHASQQISMNSPLSDTSTGEVVFTPSDSVEDENATPNANPQTRASLNPNKTRGRQQYSEMSLPPSPPSKSNACPTDPETCDSPQISSKYGEDIDNHDTQNARPRGNQHPKKTKRKSKKSKHSKVVHAPVPDQATGNDDTVLPETNDKQLASTQDAKTADEELRLVTTESQDITFVSDRASSDNTFYMLNGASSDVQFLISDREQGGSLNFIQRLQRLRSQSRQQTDFRRRQDERRLARAATDEAEKKAGAKENRNKRASKRAKALHLRRENVATDSPLSRLMELRRDTKPKDAAKRTVSAPTATTSPSRYDNNPTHFARPLESRDRYSHTDIHTSTVQDSSFRFAFDGALDRKIEEVEEDELDEFCDASTTQEELSHTSGDRLLRPCDPEDVESDEDLEKLLDQETKATHNHEESSIATSDTGTLENDSRKQDSSEDLTGHHDEAVPVNQIPRQSRVPVFNHFGQQATSGSERELMPPPGLPFPQNVHTEQAGHFDGRHDTHSYALSSNKAQERRSQWAAAARTQDDQYYAQRKEDLTKLEKKMEASGTTYSDYDKPIHDNWTKTDEAGKCIETGGENIVYDKQACDPSA